MPRILIFGVGRRAIIDTLTHRASIIDVIPGIDIDVTQAVPSKGTMAPFEWSALAVFRFDGDEVKQEYKGKHDLLLPSGEIMPISEFDMGPSDFVYTNVMNAGTLRVDEPGDIMVRFLHNRNKMRIGSFTDNFYPCFVCVKQASG